jgi:aspartyl-tRNA(Asn)/glutamyl-tRNA(Gln) amidotransferase subunit A
VTQPHWLTAGEIAKGFAEKTFSPVEITKALLARIAVLQPKLHAFIRIDEAGAMAAAQAAEAEMAAGRVRGPLHGVPVGLKDIIDVAGLPTTAHSRVLIDNVARTDAVVTSKLRQAGAVILGKLSTHEFAIGGPSFDLPWPPARNPWNPDHHPGGSSSGSGAGVAGGMFPLALGTDTGDAAVVHAGPCRADDAHRCRQCAAAGRDRGLRSGRSRQRPHAGAPFRAGPGQGRQGPADRLHPAFP